MRSAQASSRVGLPVPSGARTSRARKAPDEGASEGVRRRTDMVLLGAGEAARATMWRQSGGIESAGEGVVCVGGSYLRGTRVE